MVTSELESKAIEDAYTTIAHVLGDSDLRHRMLETSPDVFSPCGETDYHVMERWPPIQLEIAISRALFGAIGPHHHRFAIGVQPNGSGQSSAWHACRKDCIDP